MKLKQRPINDGYMMNGKFDGSILNLPTVEFVYRPASPARVFRFDSEKARTDNPEELLKVWVRMLAEHVKSWDVVDAQDKTVAVTEDSLSHPAMPVVILEYMLKAVQQYVGPEMKADEKN